MGIALLATFTVKEGTAERFEKAIAALATEVKAKEPGVLLYQLTKSRENSQSYTMLELYADQAAIDAHMKTPHMAAAQGDLMACLAAAPNMQFLDTVG